MASTLPDPAVSLSGLWPALAITWLQAVVMLLVLQLALGLDPVKPLLLYGFTLVAALAFTAIMQLLSAALGTAGKFAAVVLLMLQLTSSAGTFPTDGGLFVGLVVGVILIIGGLTFFPALALGPIVEHLAMTAGTLY